jgi:hypothetical protein
MQTLPRLFGLAIVLLVAVGGCSAVSSETVPALDTDRASQSEAGADNWVDVTLRPEAVNVRGFDAVAARGSDVDSAWFNAEAKYLLVDLESEVHHHCGVPPILWEKLIGSLSFDSYHDDVFKGRWGCD